MQNLIRKFCVNGLEKEVENIDPKKIIFLLPTYIRKTKTYIKKDNAIIICYLLIYIDH